MTDLQVLIFLVVVAVAMTAYITLCERVAR